MDTEEFLRNSDLMNEGPANQEEYDKNRPAIQNLAKLGYR